MKGMQTGHAGLSEFCKKTFGGVKHRTHTGFNLPNPQSHTTSPKLQSIPRCEEAGHTQHTLQTRARPSAPGCLRVRSVGGGAAPQPLPPRPHTSLRRSPRLLLGLPDPLSPPRPHAGEETNLGAVLRRLTKQRAPGRRCGGRRGRGLARKMAPPPLSLPQPAGGGGSCSSAPAPTGNYSSQEALG